MKAIICYYSGSGNTKLACQYIAKNIKNIEIDLFNIAKDDIFDLEQYDIVGFATFANGLGPPYLMQAFIERLPHQNKKLAFVFNTYGFINGKPLKILGKWVMAKGFKVIIGHSLHTPENCPAMIIRGIGNEQAPNKKELEDVNNFISELSQLIESKGAIQKKIKIGLLNSLLPVLPYTLMRKVMGKKYVDTSLCMECGACERVCPYAAIKLNPKPVFDMNKCYGCWACYNHCPNKAIYTRKCQGVGHYPEPNNQLKEKLKI